MLDSKDMTYVGIASFGELQKIRFCPCCGSYLMDVYIGDYWGYTNCSDCDEQVEFRVGTIDSENKVDVKQYGRQ